MSSPAPRLPAPAMPRSIARQLPFERYAIDVGGARMHVMEHGRGLPVVCLHGNPTWGYLWRKVALRLDPTRYRVIMPDLVGLGFSDKPRAASAHTLDNHIRWFGALLDRLALDRLVFAGQDWGGPIGFGALAERPDLARGLVVLNTVISPPRPDFRPTWFHRLAKLPLLSDALFRLAAFPQAYLAAFGIAQGQGDRASIDLRATFAYVAPLVDPRHNVAPLALARMVPDSLAHPSNAALTRVHRFVSAFHGPTAIVWGRRDPILGRVLGWVEKQLPHARVWRTDAGHFLQEEVPDEIAQGVAHAAQA
jgi:cis-3-alkyl-4-acyloxetan-2-one decarboxylase